MMPIIEIATPLTQHREFIVDADDNVPEQTIAYLLMSGESRDEQGELICDPLAAAAVIQPLLKSWGGKWSGATVGEIASHIQYHGSEMQFALQMVGCYLFGGEMADLRRIVESVDMADSPKSRCLQALRENRYSCRMTSANERKMILCCLGESLYTSSQSIDLLSPPKVSP